MKRMLGLVTFISLYLYANAGFGAMDRCSAAADYVRSWPLNDSKSKWAFKFKISSNECDRYSCRGYIHYTIHYRNQYGSRTSTTLVSYTIARRDHNTEVVQETYPGPTGIPIQVDDVEISDVSCTSP